MTNVTALETAIADVKRSLSEADRAIALLGELPPDLHIDFDVDAWTEKLAVKSALPKATLPVGGWFVRG